MSRLRLSTHLPTYFFLIVATFFIGFPLFVLLAQSFMNSQEIARIPPVIIPQSLTSLNYQHLFIHDDLMLPRWLFNSFYVSVIGTALVLAVAAPAAYSFARLHYPGRNVLFFVLLVTIMIPNQTTLIPNFLLMRDFKFLNTYNALIFPGVANVFAVFLLRQFFQSIPTELEEAARLDGASYFGIFRRIIIPLSTSAFVALGIFVFLAYWNDFVWPLIVTTSTDMRTLPVGLTVLNGNYGVLDRGLNFAGAIFASAPVLVVYVIFQRWIIKGITFTGMGGR